MKDELLTAKELAMTLRKNVGFVYRMCKLGFKMPGGTATVDEARVWLLNNGRPFAKCNSHKLRISK